MHTGQHSQQTSPNAGGAVSSLNLAISTAVLVDPVDMTDQTRRMHYPSAVEALQGQGATAALIGERASAVELVRRVATALFSLPDMEQELN